MLRRHFGHEKAGYGLRQFSTGKDVLCESVRFQAGCQIESCLHQVRVTTPQRTNQGMELQYGELNVALTSALGCRHQGSDDRSLPTRCHDKILLGTLLIMAWN